VKAERVSSNLRVLVVVLGALACSKPPPAVANPHVRMLQGDPNGDLAPVVAKQYAASKAEGRRLVVYVGATWCEPCQRFHHAVEQGQLDHDFPDLDLLAFDADLDGERLEWAGYHSDLIPLLALPNADGKASGQKVEGSIKGDGAVGDLAPRLRGLLGR
jgi:thiol-disulfide isomerase/thioredoxin